MKTRLMLAVLLLLTLLVAACQPQGMPVPQDPLEAVKTIAEKQKEVKSQHIDLSMALNLKLDGFDWRASAGGRNLQEFQSERQHQR